MMTEQVKQTVKQHRPAAIIGGILGLALLACWFTYVVVATPNTPVISQASAAEIVDYIADDRGLENLPEIEQVEFFKRWETHVSNSKHAEELVACLKELDDAKRAAFKEAMFKQLKRAFVEDAKLFSTLKTPGEKNEFCRKKLVELDGRRGLVERIAAVFKSDFGGQDDIQSWILRNTTPKERSLGEPFLEALKRVGEQMRRETAKRG